jgi:acyl-CoA synthetase (AMP-forming)/AMP-acid ligase II
MLVGDIIPRNAKHYPNRVAIVDGGTSYTFREHEIRVNQLANALLDRGLRRRDRISIFSPNGAPYLEVYGAGEVTGIIVNTVNFRLAPEEVRYILEDADPGVVFFDAQQTNAMTSIRQSLPSVRHFVRIGGGVTDAPAWCEPYEPFLESGSPAKPDQVPQLEDTAYLIYTSGTTGRPKGVLLGQRAQWLNSLVIAQELNARATDRWLLVMPLFHVGAKYLQLAHHLAGATIFVHRRFDAQAAVETIERERITRTHFAPTMLQSVLDLIDIDERDLSSLRMITYGTAPMSVPLLRRALEKFGPVFQQRYGSTEAAAVTALCAHQHVLDGSPEEVARLASAGQPNLMTDVRVVRDNGTDCPPGEPGELLIRNPDLIMQGYWKNPEATREVLKDGWFASGDVATMDEERFVYIVDRKHEMIISGGENIYPREVEEAIAHHSDVLDVAVIGVPDEKWGETVMAFVVLRDGQALAPGDIIEHCRSRIASYKKPSRVEFRASLPRMPSGKIDKRKLREPYWKGQQRQV